MTAPRDPERVRAMFDGIAAGYDRANTLLSFGRDGAWRRRAAAAASPSSDGSALDIACGTGRLAKELRRRGGGAGRVVGLDFSRHMLDIARRTDPAIDWVEGDATALPFADGSFDAATMAFGLRNLADPARGLAEMRRVVRPGGALVVLEFLRPGGGVVGRSYAAYLRHVVPVLGSWVAGRRDAYAYLGDTVAEYLSADELVTLAREQGWTGTTVRRLNLGTVALLTGLAT